MEQKILAKRTFSTLYRPDPERGAELVTATAILEDLAGNRAPYFSITTKNGCDHETIRAAFKGKEVEQNLDLLISLHLADEDGAPMHTEANAEYWAKEGKIDTLARHLRITQEKAAWLAEELKTVHMERKQNPLPGYYDEKTDSLGRWFTDFNLSKYLDYELRPTWKAEAEKAKAILALPPWSDVTPEQKDAATYHTLESFIKRNGLSMATEKAAENPNMTDFDGDNWKVTLRVENGKGGCRRMTSYYSMGSGHGGREPKLKEVIECLASDAASVENSRSMEEWARDLGYDEDSRKAEKIFKACQKGAEKLKTLLGMELYTELLFDTERD
jgi:hypothetical protein